MPLGIPIRFRCYIRCDGRIMVMIRSLEVVTIIINRILNLQHTTIVLMTILKIMRGIRVTITIIISNIATIMAVIVIHFDSINILRIISRITTVRV